MNKRILIISTVCYPSEQIQADLADDYNEQIDILCLDSVESLESLLLDMENPVYMIIGDVEVEGLLDFLKMMRGDELFTYLPVYMILPRYDIKMINEIFDAGMEGYILKEDAETILPRQIHRTMKSYTRFIEMRTELNEYQEKGIHDFILLDLIKNYIPRKIWHLADQFAEERKISIPEEITHLTIAFGDIKGFSTFAQYKTPREVINMLNDGFDIITRYVYKFNGDIDKFIGDAFVGVFEKPEDAMLAMYMAQKNIRILNEERKKMGRENIVFRIGINTGSAIRGNVGGNDRYDITLIGDSVNTAARLESIAPPGGIIISDSTRQALGADIPEQHRQEVELKGREGLEPVYSVYEYFLDNPHLIPGYSEDLD